MFRDFLCSSRFLPTTFCTSQAQISAVLQTKKLDCLCTPNKGPRQEEQHTNTASPGAPQSLQPGLTTPAIRVSGNQMRADH